MSNDFSNLIGNLISILGKIWVSLLKYIKDLGLEYMMKSAEIKTNKLKRNKS